MPPPSHYAKTFIASPADATDEDDEDEALPAMNGSMVAERHKDKTPLPAPLPRPGRLGMNDELTKLLSKITGEEHTTMPPPSHYAKTHTAAPAEDTDEDEEEQVTLPMLNSSTAAKSHKLAASATTPLPRLGRLGMNDELTKLLSKITGEVHTTLPPPGHYRSVQMAGAAEDAENEDESAMVLPSLNQSVQLPGHKRNATSPPTSLPRPGMLGVNDDLTKLLSKITGEAHTTLPPPGHYRRVQMAGASEDGENDDESAIVLPTLNGSAQLSEAQHKRKATAAPTPLPRPGMLGMNDDLTKLLSKITGEVHTTLPPPSHYRRVQMAGATEDGENEEESSMVMPTWNGSARLPGQQRKLTSSEIIREKM